MRFLTVLLLVVSLPALANTPSAEQLQALQDQISDIQASLSDATDERSEAQAALRQVEVRMGEISRKQAELTQQQHDNHAKQQQLLSQQHKLLNNKAAQVNALARLTQERYVTGEQSRLKLLLNQQEPGKTARILQYQAYIQAARNERITALNQSLTQLEAVSKKLLTVKQQLTDTAQALESQKQQMQAARTQRKSVLATLDTKIHSKKGQLQQLKANRKHLKKLLDEMQEAISDIPPELNKQPFGELAGKLPWPVSGKLLVGFHDPILGRRWEGVVIKAKRGEPVRAIHSGRVVYANWLSGYGLLTIIDQSNGYLTLYGYNQNLTQSVGNWVSAGDIIAHAGASGGRRHAALYFGIRHNGKPLNPDHWCTRRVHF